MLFRAQVCIAGLTCWSRRVLLARFPFYQTDMTRNRKRANPNGRISAFGAWRLAIVPDQLMLFSSAAIEKSVLQSSPRDEAGRRRFVGIIHSRHWLEAGLHRFKLPSAGIKRGTSLFSYRGRPRSVAVCFTEKGKSRAVVSSPRTTHHPARIFGAHRHAHQTQRLHYETTMSSKHHRPHLSPVGSPRCTRRGKAYTRQYMNTLALSALNHSTMMYLPSQSPRAHATS